MGPVFGVLQMWGIQKMLKILWKEKVKNDKTLTRVGLGRYLFIVVKQRKSGYLGHIFRGEKTPATLFGGYMIAGKRRIGRKSSND